MSAGFDPIPFQGSAMLWNDRQQTTQPSLSFYHWHQCCELLLVYDGNGTVVLNNKTYPIRKGMLFIFQPFEIHKVFAKSTEQHHYDRIVVHVNHLRLIPLLAAFPRRQRLFEQLCYSQSTERAFDLGERFDAARQCMEDYERLAHTSRGATQEEVSLFMLLLLSQLEDVVLKNSTSGRRSKEYSEKMMNWIEEYYMEDDILDKLATELHLTRSYVSRQFKKETGSTLSEYLAAKRIKVAAHLLESTSSSIESIAHQIGFRNVSHFIGSFKKTYLITPLQYRIKNEHGL